MFSKIYISCVFNPFNELQFIIYGKLNMFSQGQEYPEKVSGEMKEEEVYCGLCKCEARLFIIHHGAEI